MKLLNKKGMTLFELLAVIVILGIVAAIAFPTVNKLIDNNKQDAVAANVNNYINAAILDAQSDAVATQTAVTRSYEYTSNTLELKSGLFTAGEITVVVAADGSLTSVTVIENFCDGVYSTNLTTAGGVDITTKDFDRDDVNKSATPVPLA